MAKKYTDECILAGEFECTWYHRLCNMHTAENKDCIEAGGIAICGEFINGYDFSFMNENVYLDNIGMHEGDNIFLLENTAIEQLVSFIIRFNKIYKKIVLIGICMDDMALEYDEYRPLVFEDSLCNRHYIHIPYSKWKEDFSMI
jgi:hypothetical protein